MGDIERLKELIDASDNIVFFGGAGVSTESGIPDFRSKDGLYNQHDVRFDMYQPEYLLSHSCLVYEPKVYYEFHRQKMDTRDIEPNNAHKYLAALEKTGKLKAVVTQNIDGLHQKAGSRTVYEIHGSALRNYCMKCGKEYPADYIFKSEEPIPKCDCGGTIRPDITLYEGFRRTRSRARLTPLQGQTCSSSEEHLSAFILQLLLSTISGERVL